MSVYPRISRISLAYLISHFHYVLVGAIVSVLGFARARPVFVIGVGHTGTTVVCNKLGESCEVYACPQETEMFLGGALRRYLYSMCLQGGAYIRNKHFFVEKTPMHREELTQILKYFPNAVIIVTSRDIKETVASQLTRKGFSEKVIRDVFCDYIGLYKQLLNGSLKDLHIVRLEELETDLQSIFQCYKLSSSQNSYEEHYEYNWIETLFETFGLGYEVTEHEKLRMSQIRDNTKSDNTKALDLLEAYEHRERVVKIDAALRELLEASIDRHN
jgi:hypothetical protein